MGLSDRPWDLKVEYYRLILCWKSYFHGGAWESRGGTLDTWDPMGLVLIDIDTDRVADTPGTNDTTDTSEADDTTILVFFFSSLFIYLIIYLLFYDFFYFLNFLNGS